MSSTPQEGLQRRGRWGRQDEIPYDEVEGYDEPDLRLAGGIRWSVPAAERPSLVRALSPPKASGRLDEDGRGLLDYVSGPWSPVRAAAALVAMAESLCASDVHFEPEGDVIGVRLRRAGLLQRWMILPGGTGRRLIAALKHLSGCLPYRGDLVQEGRIRRQGVAADVRASFLPTTLGERAALRLFGQLLDLGSLGLDDATLAAWTAALGQPSGLLLVAGPSGGGKTTTLYATLAAIASRRGGAHLSIEDPVEQRLRVAGIPVDQLELDPARGLTAEVALVGALRQDLDVLALGEIRTPGEARIALEAAHTGRLVLAGLHAGSTSEASRRLLDLGVDAMVLAQTLRGVLHQRLEAGPCPEGADPNCARCAGVGRWRRPVTSIWLAEGIV